MKYNRLTLGMVATPGSGESAHAIASRATHSATPDGNDRVPRGVLSRIPLTFLPRQFRRRSNVPDSRQDVRSDRPASGRRAIIHIVAKVADPVRFAGRRVDSPGSVPLRLYYLLRYSEQ